MCSPFKVRNSVARPYIDEYLKHFHVCNPADERAQELMHHHQRYSSPDIESLGNVLSPDHIYISVTDKYKNVQLDSFVVVQKEGLLC